MVHRVLRREIGRRQVVVPVRDPDLEKRVLRHRLLQGLRDVQVFILHVAVAPRLHRAGEDLVGQVVFVLQLAAHVVVQRGRVAAIDRLHARIEETVRAVADARDPAVQPADGAVLAPPELGDKLENVDPQVLLQHVVHREPGERGQLRRDPLVLRRGQRIARHEGKRVVLHHKFLGARQGRGQVLGEVALQFAMVKRRRGVGRQEELVGQVVARRKPRRLEIHDRGDEHDPVQVKIVLPLQVVGQPGGARRAVAFPHKEFRRGPALIPGCPEADELAHRLDVARETVELLRIHVLRRPAVTRRDRVDEYQIRLVQPGVLVVHPLVGRRQRFALVRHDHALRPEHPEVQPHRG